MSFKSPYRNTPAPAAAGTGVSSFTYFISADGITDMPLNCTATLSQSYIQRLFFILSVRLRYQNRKGYCLPFCVILQLLLECFHAVN